MNLPRAEKYRITGTFHTGGIENACACDNCGRAIVEVAELSDAKGNLFRVGMDCAETLTVDFFEMESAKATFAERRAFSTKIRKARKVHPSAKAEVHEYAPGTGFFKQGGFSVQFGPQGANGAFWKNFPIESKAAILPLCV